MGFRNSLAIWTNHHRTTGAFLRRHSVIARLVPGNPVKKPSGVSRYHFGGEAASFFARIIPDTRPSGSLRSRKIAPGDFFSMCLWLLNALLSFRFTIAHHSSFSPAGGNPSVVLAKGENPELKTMRVTNTVIIQTTSPNRHSRWQRESIITLSGVSRYHYVGFPFSSCHESRMFPALFMSRKIFLISR